ncbi:hypothetical protein ABZ372_49480, partial [Streptomyces sp. NPDC005921]
MVGAVVNNGGNTSCTKRSATTSVCRATFTIDPAWIAERRRPLDLRRRRTRVTVTSAGSRRWYFPGT